LHTPGGRIARLPVEEYRCAAAASRCFAELSTGDDNVQYDAAGRLNIGPGVHVGKL
jgi:hypothetical protein